MLSTKSIIKLEVNKLIPLELKKGINIEDIKIQYNNLSKNKIKPKDDYIYI